MEALYATDTPVVASVTLWSKRYSKSALGSVKLFSKGIFSKVVPFASSITQNKSVPIKSIFLIVRFELIVKVNQEFKTFWPLEPYNQRLIYNLFGLSVPNKTKISWLFDTANLKIWLGISLGTWIVVLVASLTVISDCVIYSLTPANVPFFVKK